MSKDDMAECLKNYNMKSPVSGNDLSEPIEFNLMFSTSIGPTGHLKGLVTFSWNICFEFKFSIIQLYIKMKIVPVIAQ